MGIIEREDFKFNIEKYGFFFWFVLFGFAVILFSIVYRPEYVMFGLSFCLYGLAGYIIRELMDRYSKRYDAGKIPFSFYVLSSLINVVLSMILFFLINMKYHFYF